MKNLIKRIIAVILFSLIIYLFFSMIAKLSIKTEYKYLTYEDKWGTSNNCYEESEYLICINDKELIKVKQFYYEE